MLRNVQVGSLITISVLGFGFTVFSLWPLIHTINSVGTVALVSDEDVNPHYADNSNGGNSSAQSQTLKILFGGDIFLDRTIRRTIEARGIDYLWQDIAPLLGNYPYKVANLEGPILATKEAAPAGSFTFAFQPDYVKKLKDLDFTAVSLANNHTLNQGEPGLENTRKVLDGLGLPYFGDPSNIASASFLKTELAGRKIALVGEHDLVPDGQEDILATVRKLKGEGYFVIMYPHWGVEYVTSTAPTIERERAHALVDAGADLVIGAHPHVVQPIELYKDKVIFYSLGNFLFDQYFSFDTLHGLLVGLEMNDQELKFTLLPTEQDKTYQIHLASDAARSEILARLALGSGLSEALKAGIIQGSFSVPIPAAQ